jgi:hypothetical protein
VTAPLSRDHDDEDAPQDGDMEELESPEPDLESPNVVLSAIQKASCLLFDLFVEYSMTT